MNLEPESPTLRAEQGRVDAQMHHFPGKELEAWVTLKVYIKDKHRLSSFMEQLDKLILCNNLS